MRVKNVVLAIFALSGAVSFSCDLQTDLFSKLPVKSWLSITVRASGNGGVDPSGTFVVDQNPLPIRAIPDPGYELGGWTSARGSAFGNPNAESTTVSIAENGDVITAVFIQSTLEVSFGTGGTATGGGPISPGNPMAIDATASTGYDFSGWTKLSGNGTPVFADASAPSTTVTVTGGSCVVSANFRPQPFTIHVTQPPHGRITLSPSHADEVYDYNTSVAVEWVPDPGYVFIGWNATDSVPISTNPDSFTVSGNGTIACDVQFRCPTPTGFLVTTSATTGASAASSLSMVWDAPSDPAVTTPEILFERSEDGGLSWVSITPTIMGSSAVDSGLDPGTRYYYRIKLHDAGFASNIDSAWTDTRMGMTLNWNGTTSMPVFGPTYLTAPPCPVPTDPHLPFELQSANSWMPSELPGQGLMAGGYTFFLWGTDTYNTSYLVLCAFDSAGNYSGFFVSGSLDSMNMIGFNDSTGVLTIYNATGSHCDFSWSALRAGIGM